MDEARTPMMAVVVEATAPGRLKLVEVPRPVPAAHEALVRVAAVSLNRGEVRTAMAASDGWRPGWDFAGVVEAAAADGSGPRAGARVVGLAGGGAWAPLVAAAPAFLALVPDEVSLEAAATAPVAGLTARAALAHGPPRRGRRVLVTGASGGVGVFAIQLAAITGDEVFAAIRDPAQEGLVRRLGAQRVLIGESLAQAAGEARFDLVVESVGAQTLGTALERLAPGGICVVLGASAGSQTTFDVSRFRAGGTSLYGLALPWELAGEPPATGLTELMGHMAAGRLTPVIEARAGAAQAGAVAEALMARRFVGKAVLTFGQDG